MPALPMHPIGQTLAIAPPSGLNPWRSIIPRFPDGSQGETIGLKNIACTLYCFETIIRYGVDRRAA